MVTAIHDIDVDVDNRVASNDAVVSRLLEALDTGGDVVLGNVAADNLVFNGDSLSARIRRDLDDDVTVLPAAARLLDELSDRKSVV